MQAWCSPHSVGRNMTFSVYGPMAVMEWGIVLPAGPVTTTSRHPSPASVASTAHTVNLTLSQNWPAVHFIRPNQTQLTEENYWGPGPLANNRVGTTAGIRVYRKYAQKLLYMNQFLAGRTNRKNHHHQDMSSFCPHPLLCTIQAWGLYT